MKDYKHIEHMRNLNDSLIWERMKRCYDYGYEDGKADTPFTETEEAEEKAYNRGLNESWELVRKIINDENNGGYSYDYLLNVFGYRYLFEVVDNYTVSEVIAKIKAYENKQKRDEEYCPEFEISYEIIKEDY